MSAVGGSSTRGLMKRPSIRRVYSSDNLPMVRFWFHGPKWRRHCGVESRLGADTFIPTSDVITGVRYSFKATTKHVLIATLEEEIRERIMERIYADTYAMWSDARERLFV